MRLCGRFHPLPLQLAAGILFIRASQLAGATPKRAPKTLTVVAIANNKIMQVTNL